MNNLINCIKLNKIFTKIDNSHRLRETRVFHESNATDNYIYYSSIPRNLNNLDDFKLAIKRFALIYY